MSDRTPEQILEAEIKRLTAPNAVHVPGLLAPNLPAVSSGHISRQGGGSPNRPYTLPVAEATQPPASTGHGALGTIGSTMLKTFTSGLGLVPLISGLAGLFGGHKSAPPPPLVPYAMPRSIHISAADSPGSSGGYQLTDFGQTGTPRAFDASFSEAGTPPWPAAAPGSPPGAAASSSPQVVVNVSAMDSQSFLDRSHDIAQAVRQAMLNMHSINDVVSEL